MSIQDTGYRIPRTKYSVHSFGDSIAGGQVRSVLGSLYVLWTLDSGLYELRTRFSRIDGFGHLDQAVAIKSTVASESQTDRLGWVL